MVSQIGREVDDNWERVHHVESKMGDFAVAHNELVDVHNGAEDELQAIKWKLAYLEYRSRRNNVKFCGVAETIPPSELCNYIQQLISALLPDVPKREITVDR